MFNEQQQKKKMGIGISQNHFRSTIYTLKQCKKENFDTYK